MSNFSFTLRCMKISMMRRYLTLSALLLALTLPVRSANHTYFGGQRVTETLHPALIQLLTSGSSGSQRDHVDLIIQAKGAPQKVSQTVTRLGGHVAHDLSIINALAASIPLYQLPALAADHNVRWITPDAPTFSSDWNGGTCENQPCFDPSQLVNNYVRAVRADQVWNTSTYLQGQGVGVAVIDSGITDLNDFKEQPNGNGNLRVRATQIFVSGTDAYKDWYGHGTHVASVIGGNGAKSYGKYVGVAPKVNLISITVSNDQGQGTTSSVISGLQWVLQNKAQHNIRVVNISLNSSVAEPYYTSLLNAAVEVLWFNGIVVVVSAGNNGVGPNNGILYPPANDPFVITVGATDSNGTDAINNDVIPSFSASGTTESGFTKPDLVAPGKNIIGVLSKPDTNLALSHPTHKLSDATLKDYYFRMSGTSMAAPVVSGVVALLLQDEPNLTPDQVKFRLKATANKSWSGYNASRAGAGYVDAYAAVFGNTTANANTGIQASQLLWSGSQPVTWGSVNWNSVNWNSVNWNSVNWNSVNWNSVNWNSDYWGQ